MSRRKLGVMLFVGFVLWTTMIFYFSSQPPSVSHSQSRRVVQIITTINEIFDITDTKLYAKIEGILKDLWLMGKYKTPNAVVRKSAHFGIYFILGTICSAFGYAYSKKMLMGVLLGISLPVAIAVLDEFNQGFVGRTSSLTDVLIDGAGAFTGTMAMLLLILLLEITKAVKKK